MTEESLFHEALALPAGERAAFLERMCADNPGLRAAVEAEGLNTIAPEISELTKGGGYIRCTTLTLSNL